MALGVELSRLGGFRLRTGLSVSLAIQWAPRLILAGMPMASRPLQLTEITALPIQPRQDPFPRITSICVGTVPLGVSLLEPRVSLMSPDAL